jgi:hypothetical protein
MARIARQSSPRASAVVAGFVVAAATVALRADRASTIENCFVGGGSPVVSVPFAMVDDLSFCHRRLFGPQRLSSAVTVPVNTRVRASTHIYEQ